MLKENKKIDKKGCDLLIFFGASSNLFQTKILPALYKIILENLEKYKSNNIFILGTTNNNTKKEDIINVGKKNYELNKKLNDKKIDDNFLSIFSNNFYYIYLDFNDKNSWLDFKNKLIEINNNIKNKFKINNKIVYLSVFSKFYKIIIENLNNLDLLNKYLDKNTKFVFEKPFGWNYQSAIDIKKYILKYINRNNIFNIDHYISKDIVNTLISISNTNIFKYLWSSKYIEYIKIIMEEKEDLNGRINSYNDYGALLDVVQNHLLQLASIMLIKLERKNIDLSKLKYNILKNIKPISGYLGQYKEYQNYIKDSKTETFAFLELELKNRRWNNTKIYIKTGKALKEDKKEIIIKFKNIENFKNNYLIIKLTYLSSYNLLINNSLNNIENEINLSFCYDCSYDIHTSYYNIIKNIIINNKDNTITFNEIEAQWEIIDKIKNMNLPLYYYENGSEGPKIKIDF